MLEQIFAHFFLNYFLNTYSSNFVSNYCYCGLENLNKNEKQNEK